MQLPHLQVSRAVVQRFGRVLSRYGDELGSRPLVLPNADFFPDVFAGDQASLQRLLGRLQGHAGMSDIPIEVRVVPREPDGGPQGGSCSSGACSPPAAAGADGPRLVDLDDRWLLQVPEAELSHPVVLTTNLSRSLAYVFLAETRLEGEVIEPPLDVTADFVAVGLGLGALMLQGSYIYSKSCGGPSVASVTKVGVGELAIVVALFMGIGKHPHRAALRELDTTQRALLEEARDLIESNRSVVTALRADPAAVARGTFELEAATGWLGRLFAGRRKTTSTAGPDGLETDLTVEEIESMLVSMAGLKAARASGPMDPKREELKELVSEALSEDRAIG